MGSILVTGALGQVGAELTPALRERYGPDRVVATDLREPEEDAAPRSFRTLDCTDRDAVRATVQELEVETVYHLAAILS
ncbi:MAG TPA: NAD-dependent epimerase/dehydratase family protein, partial [Longimicrobiales bacterium]|nr:NAD-dependent epimerase/dehydratase family protein [Longimicrobiales bacterium]